MSESPPALSLTIGEYFNSLVAQKLERKEALELTICYLENLLEGQRERGEDA